MNNRSREKLWFLIIFSLVSYWPLFFTARWIGTHVHPKWLQSVLAMVLFFGYIGIGSVVAWVYKTKIKKR